MHAPIGVRTEGSRTYLEGVRPMDWGTGEMCELVSALTRTLDCAGEDVPYHYVMSVTGVAFRFSMGPELWNPGFHGFEEVSADVHGWWYAKRSLEPTDEGFTGEYFGSLFATLEPDDARSVKYFLISEPGVWGLGNGYLQDILLAARIHPRCRAVDLGKAQQRALHKAVLQTIKRAVRLHGRTDEHDLFGETGGYERLLSASAAGLPCPACGQAAIAKESFLGGAIYTCPQCQPAPPKPPKRVAKKKS